MNMSKSRDIQVKMPSPKVIYASNESKSVLARNLEECRDNDKNSQSVFLSFKCILARNCEGTEQLHLRKEILLLYYHVAYLIVFQYTARRSRMTRQSERRATLCGRLEAILRSGTYVDFRECQLTLVNISRSWWLAQNDSAHVATF